MGYCTYGGKLVPGNTQASCIGGGGNWVGGETGPDTQVSMPPIGSPIQLPNIGRPPIRPEPDRGILGYQAPQISQSPMRMWDNTDDFGNRLNTNQFGQSNFGLQRDRAVGKYNQDAYDGTGIFNSSNRRPGQLGAEDIPGHGPMNVTSTPTKPAGIFDVTSVKDLQYPQGKVTPARESIQKVTAPFTRPFVEGSEVSNPILIAEANNIIERPIETAIQYYTGLKLLQGLNWASKPLKNKFINTYVTKNKKWQAPTRGADGKIITGGKEVDSLGLNYNNAAKTVLGGSVVAADVMSDDSEIRGGFNSAMDKLTPAQQADVNNAVSSFGDTAGNVADATTGFFADRWNLGNRDNTSVDTATKPNIFLAPDGTVKNVEKGTTVTPPTADDKPTTKTPPTPPAPKDKDVIEKGLGGLWSNMQKPGYWSDKVEGGSGSWDNRLFRLGEMMSYMGKHPSRQGDNPSKRWTTAAASANKTAEATKKAQDAAAAKKLKDANYNWKLKEITDIASDKFDSWFGTDIPMFGKSKDEQRSRFLSDLTDAKAAYGASKSLQQIIEDLLREGDYK
jgi:hypothetical protein